MNKTRKITKPTKTNQTAR